MFDGQNCPPGAKWLPKNGPFSGVVHSIGKVSSFGWPME